MGWSSPGACFQSSSSQHITCGRNGPQRGRSFKKQLTAIAYTRGPGLMGSLLVGSSFARAMGSALNIPTIPVHHMEAHILAHFIEDEIQTPPEFPFLCLTVSGVIPSWFW